MRALCTRWAFSPACVRKQCQHDGRGGAQHGGPFAVTFTPSAQRYSYFGPAHIVGQLSAVQHSVSVPYSMDMALKKSTVLTASLRRPWRVCRQRRAAACGAQATRSATHHSFKSSPGGSCTCASSSAGGETSFNSNHRGWCVQGAPHRVAQVAAADGGVYVLLQLRVQLRRRCFSGPERPVAARREQAVRRSVVPLRRACPDSEARPCARWPASLVIQEAGLCRAVKRVRNKGSGGAQC
jgi:hypothetical protein